MIRIEDARPDDIPALASECYTEAMHRERIAQADGKTLRYLVIRERGVVLGFGCLLLGQPPAWPPVRELPRIVDLYVVPERRHEGFGTRLVVAMEKIARDAGHTEIFCTLDPQTDNHIKRYYGSIGYRVAETELDDETKETSFCELILIRKELA